MNKEFANVFKKRRINEDLLEKRSIWVEIPNKTWLPWQCCSVMVQNFHVKTLLKKEEQLLKDLILC